MNIGILIEEYRLTLLCENMCLIFQVAPTLKCKGYALQFILPIQHVVYIIHSEICYIYLVHITGMFLPNLCMKCSTKHLF